MKKKLFFMFCLLLFPAMTNAKEYCTIVNGTGNNIGDEIKCGTESFYVVSSDKEKVSLLAKYNLFVGDKISYVDAENKDLTRNSWSSEIREYCMNVAVNAGYNPYIVYAMFNEDKTVKGCRIYEQLQVEYIRQDERAVGTKLDGNGKSILPLYGITYMNARWGYDYVVNRRYYDNLYDSNGDLILDDTSGFTKYMYGYYDELEAQGIEVDSVSFLTFSKTMKILEDISGKKIKLKFEKVSDELDRYDIEYFVRKMNVKNYIGKQHKWIYDVTYWLGSGFYGGAEAYYDGVVPDYTNDYYVSNEGYLCAIGRGDCAYFDYPIGNGVRPLVTIPRSSIIYNIHTKTDGNGTIEVVETANGGDKITFKVTSEKGYVLNDLIVITDAGEKVKLKNGKNTSNVEGIVSIDNNEFTMPYDNVTVEANWQIENPNTFSPIFSIFLILVVFGMMFYFLRKKSFRCSVKLR